MRDFASSRREMLERALALGIVSAGAGFASQILAAALESASAQRPATPGAALGPFYKARAPANAQLRNAGDPGLPLVVSGQVLDVRGAPVPQASVEIWQADHIGKYDLEGYRYRARIVGDGVGSYSFESVMPGHYPGRVCQHVHYRVTAPGHKPLVTQLYFATDPIFEGDPARNYARDPVIGSVELVRPVMLKGDPAEIHADVRFDLVLETL